MKKQVLYIHGGDSYSRYEDFLQSLKTIPVRNLPNSETSKIWTATLVEDLGEEFEVFTLSMPNKQNSKYTEWKIWLERYFEYLQDDVILLGWSLGGMFLAKYLSENNFPVKVKALYILGAPSGQPKVESDGNDCGDFRFQNEQLINLAKQVENINIWHSKDDFVVPYTEIAFYQEYLPDANLVTFDDKNHFLVAELPQLIEEIKKL